MYKALICRIKTFPHPNADRLQLGNAHGFQVIVGKDVVDNQLGIFFPTDGQLSIDYCNTNNLLSYIDANGIRCGGYFSKKRKVKSQKFRGEKSDGFWMPLESLAYTGYDLSSLKEGDQIDYLGKTLICEKYFSAETLRSLSKRRNNLRKTNPIFKEHLETAQLKYEIDSIPKGALIYFTEKLHGTSGRYGYVLDTVITKKHPIFSWLTKYFKSVKDYVSHTQFNYLNGTRRTILANKVGEGFYGGEKFRETCVLPLVGHLQKNEVVYYEIVGYTELGSPIQSHQSEGKIIPYSYGSKVGFCDIYVYRIAHINEDGYLVELSWNQVKHRCSQLGVKYVPEIQELPSPLVYDGNKDSLLKLIEPYVDTASLLDSSHIREGIVLRIESPKETRFLKQKGFTFCVLEGIVKEDDKFVDIEDIS